MTGTSCPDQRLPRRTGLSRNTVKTIETAFSGKGHGITALLRGHSRGVDGE
jgi:hypothetical protein